MIQRFVHEMSLALGFVLLTGCAASSASFYKSPSAVSDVQLCRTVNSSAAKADPKFRQDVARELVSRGYDRDLCQRLIALENAKIADALGAVAGAAAAGYAAGTGSEYGGYGNGYGGYKPVVADYSWEWDQFYNEYYQLVWRCRGVQTGQFADDLRCQWRVKTDRTWPSKVVPR